MFQLNDEEKIRKQKFVAFLKEHNVLYEFIIEFYKGNYNFEKDMKHKEKTDFSFNAFIHFYKDQPFGYIEYAFDWSKTKLQPRFWCDLSHKESNIWKI